MINTPAAGGMTIIVVEHVMEGDPGGHDQVMVLNQGTLLMTGSPREVLSDPRVIEAYLGQKYAQRQAGVRQVLEVHNLSARYGRVEVLWEVDLFVGSKEIVRLSDRTGREDLAAAGAVRHGQRERRCHVVPAARTFAACRSSRSSTSASRTSRRAAGSSSA